MSIESKQFLGDAAEIFYSLVRRKEKKQPNVINHSPRRKREISVINYLDSSFHFWKLIQLPTFTFHPQGCHKSLLQTPNHLPLGVHSPAASGPRTDLQKVFREGEPLQSANRTPFLSPLCG